MSPSKSSNRFAVVGLAAALISGHEHSTPQPRLPTAGPLPSAGELETGEGLHGASECQAYIERGLVELPNPAGLSTLVQVGRQAIPTLELIASDRDSPFSLRNDAIQAIGEIGGDKALSSLNRILHLTTFDIHGGMLLRAGIEAISNTGEPSAFYILNEIAQGRHRFTLDPNGLNRLAAVTALGRLNSRDAFEALWSVASNPDNSEEIRLSAFSGLRRFGDLYAESQERLLALLEGPQKLSRAHLLAQSAYFGLSEFVPELVSISLDRTYSTKERAEAVRGLRTLRASGACELLVPLLSSEEGEIAAATMRFLVSEGDSIHFSALIAELRRNPERVERFPREQYVERALEDDAFLFSTSETLEPVVHHAILRCERSDLSILDAVDYGAVLSVAISGVAQRMATREVTLAAHLGGGLTFADTALVDSYMRLITQYPVVAPTWALSKLTAIAGSCPEPFLAHIANPALADHFRAALAGAIMRSGDKEAIDRLDPALAQAFRDAFSLRVSGILPLDGVSGTFSLSPEPGDLLKSIDAFLDNQRELSALSLKRVADPSLPIAERLTSIKRIRSISSEDCSAVLEILSSPIEAIRLHMAIRALMIASIKEIPRGVEERLGEVFPPYVRRLCATTSTNLFFEHTESEIWDQISAAAAHLYTPRFCVELLALADCENFGDRQEVLGLLNRKVMNEDGYRRFTACLRHASEDRSLNDGERARAVRYHSALVAARQIGMRSPFRFSIDLIERMVEDTKVRVGDRRPAIVVSFAKADHNQASVFFRNQLREMADRGFRLVFMEPGDEEELSRRSCELRSIMTASEIEGASAIFIFGHGSKTRIALGEKVTDELYLIDPSDRGELSALGSLLKVGGVVVHLSCENGRGGAGSGNMVEFHREDVFPQAGAERIIAPRTSTTLTGVRIIYKDDEIIDVIFPVEAFKG